jgi:hypothetical protein
MDLLEAIFALLRAVLKAVTEKSDDALLDRAYGCFGFLGVASLPFGIAALLSHFGLMNFDEGSNGFTWTLVFGMLLGPLLLVGILVASVWGVVLTVKFWRHSALVVLTVVSIVCGGGGIIYISHSDAPNLPHYLDNAVAIGAAIYVAANVLLPAWWFAIGRRRYRSKALAQE